MSYIDPASCPPHKTYYGIVRSDRGTHERILQRNSDRPSTFPWEYYRNPGEGGPKNATDNEVSELVEIDPGTFRSLRQDVKNLTKFLSETEDKLSRANSTIRVLTGDQTKPSLTEDRVRELAREEINKTHWELRGLNITHKELQ